MLVVALLETTTHLVRDLVFGNTNAAERPGCEQLLAHLGRLDLILMDRRFAAVGLFARILGQDTHLMSRIPSTWNPVKIERLGPGDWLVAVEGTDRDSGHMVVIAVPR